MAFNKTILKSDWLIIIILTSCLKIVEYYYQIGGGFQEILR